MIDEFLMKICVELRGIKFILQAYAWGTNEVIVSSFVI